MLISKKINILVKLLSPLSHFGDENMGTMQIMRTMKFNVNGEFLDVPVFSGNAFRGILRREIMKDYIINLGLNEEGINEKLYYILFCGGALEQGSIFSSIGKKREFRKMCPPISLFGTACGDTMFEGKLKIGILIPVCKELKDYTNIQSSISFYDMLEEIFYVRKDDLKSCDRNVKSEEKDKKKNDDHMQMKYEIQCLGAGTEMQTNIYFDMLNEIELSCVYRTLTLLKNKEFIGGKSSIGHGKIELILKENIENCNKYLDYINSNKDLIKEYLKNLV